MKSNKAMAYAVLGIGFVLFSVIVIIIPSEKTATFWIGYVFTVVAFALQIAVWRFAFNGSDALKSKFLGIPLISVGLRYLLIQVLTCLVFTVISSAPSWVAVIICILILGISAICLVGTEAGKEEINRVENNIEKKVFCIKSLQTEVEMLAEAEKDPDTRTALIKLAEKIRFSDPISNEALSDLELKIAENVKELKISKDKFELISKINLLLIERNKKTKILK